MNLRNLLLGSAAGSLALAIPLATANAQSSTETYTYDALGRLVAAKTVGGQNNNETHSICYDDAGNRSQYVSNTTGTPTTCTGNPAPPTGPSFSVGNASATEGGSLTFTITKSAASASVYSVSYATVDGTAIAGNDYTAVSGILTFQPAETSKTVTVATVNNSIYEPTETFYLDLVGISGGASVSDGRGDGTITDDEVPNNPPVANSESYAFSCGGGYYTVTYNDSDPDGHAIHIQSVSGPLVSSYNTTTIYVNGTSTPGTYNINYTIADIYGATDSATLTLTWVYNSQQCGGGGGEEQ